MRTIVFFDLPTDTPEGRRSYTRFRKFLLKEGFMMLQYSVYSKLAINKTVAKQIATRLEQNKPASGNIAVLEITEKQFADIQWILGSKRSNILDTTDRLTVYDEE
ncbi:CRISPR-associated endonuclease Cas2 [Lachnospiraceae bacterium ZAX-1]